MADAKWSDDVAFPNDASPALTDAAMGLADPDGTPANVKVLWQAVLDLFVANGLDLSSLPNSTAPDTDDKTLILEDGSPTWASPANVRTMINVEDGADVTDATNVNAAGAVMESDYDANTILAATSDNTPVALTVAEQRVVGRITSGAIDDLTPAQLAGIIDDADIFAIKAFATTNQTFSNTNGRRIGIEDVGGDIRLALYLNSTDTQPLFVVGTFLGLALVFQLGPGGSTTPETVMSRIRASVIGSIKPGGGAFPFLGRITSNITAVGNVGTGEDTLQTRSLEASTLATDGDSIIARWVGTGANNANAKQLRFKFGTTNIFQTGALPTGEAFDWMLQMNITRTGAATQDCWVSGIFKGTTTTINWFDFVTATETLSGALNVRCTGEAVSNNDLVSELFTVDWYSAP